MHAIGHAAGCRLRAPWLAVRALALCAALAAAPAFAQGLTRMPDLARPVAREAAPDTDPSVATVYRGVLGEQRVQMTLMPDEDTPGSFVGEYFVFGGGRNIQLAGEIDQESFYLEESEDGRNISGFWDGQLVIEANRAYIVGTWHSGDDTASRPFKLERVLRTRSFVKRAT